MKSWKAALASCCMSLASLAGLAAAAAPFAYASNEGSASISVIDTATDRVVATLKIGAKPRGIAISADGSRLYVSDQTANALLVHDLGANASDAAIINSLLTKGKLITD